MLKTVGVPTFYFENSSKRWMFIINIINYRKNSSKLKHFSFFLTSFLWKSLKSFWIQNQIEYVSLHNEAMLFCFRNIIKTHKCTSAAEILTSFRQKMKKKKWKFFDFLRASKKFLPSSKFIFPRLRAYIGRVS